MVHANMLGHAAFTAEHVSVRPDFTTELNITLKTEAVQMGEVHVDAERPLLQKDATGTTRFLNSADIQKLPTRGYRDAAAQQTGVVNFQRNIDNEAQNQNTLIVRGGRPNEVAYYVDGFSQQDPLTGTSSTSISNNAIEEVVLLTGGFAPEYGRVMSGAVNVITREGGGKFFGALEGVTDNLAGDWISAPKTDYNIYDASLGGPIIPGSDNLTFYFSGERRWERDRSPTFIPPVVQDELISQGLDPGVKPNNQSGGWTYQGKLNWQVNDHMNLKVGGLGSQDDWRQYLNTYLFDQAHMPRYADRNISYFSTFNHVLST
jgi:outer membrane receptor for ferrienterochelin and colicin